MKILFLTTHLNLGGISSYTFSLAKSLKRRGHHILIASSGGAIVNEVKRQGITHITININTKSELSPKVPLAIFKLRSIIKSEGIEIIHAQTRVAQVIAEGLAKLNCVPYVSTCHGFFRPHWARRVFGCWGSRVIAISEAVREHLVNDLKVKKESVVLVYNGVDIARFSQGLSESEKEKFRNQAGLGDGPLIGIIARLSPVKGHKYLLEAMRKVVDLKPAAQLLIIGDGTLKEELLNQVISLGLKENVIFLGSLVDTAKPLSLIDIFVLPSLKEGLGISILEAQAAGVPVVASDVGGIYTIIKDNENGFLVPSRDSLSLAAAIIKLINNPTLANKMSEVGRRLMREEFSLDEMAKRIEEVYIQCIEV